MEKEGKTVGIAAYCTLIGYIVAWVLHTQDKTKFGAFHLRQATGIMATAIAWWILVMIFGSISFSVLWFLSKVSIIIWLGVLALMIIGIINAVNEEEKELPVVGKFYSQLFKGIE